MNTAPAAVRERGFSAFDATNATNAGSRTGLRQWLMRGHNFWVEWAEFGESESAAAFDFESGHESLLIVHRGEARVQRTLTDEAASVAPGHSTCIVPAGRWTVRGGAGTAVALIASERSDIADRAVLYAEGCEPRDPRVVPSGRPYRRRAPIQSVQVLDIDEIRASPDKPRLKMLQTETLSINLVEYDGPRDRRELSPHHHDDFEQGSLALEGHFLHHLRVGWEGDANLWREDEHLPAPSPSLLVVPVKMIHTTEGVGEGHHFLIDVFSPPRADFIGKGWVFNAKDYEATSS